MPGWGTKSWSSYNKGAGHEVLEKLAQGPSTSLEALDGQGCPQALSQLLWPLMGDRRVMRKQAMNTVLFQCLGSVDGPLPESNIVHTIMEFLSFLHLKGMGVFST